MVIFLFHQKGSGFMATDNRLSILITGQLDLKNTEKLINQQLKNLKKENVNLNVNFQTEKLNKFTTAVRKQVISYEQWWANALLKEEKQREQILQAEHKIRRKIEQLQLEQQQREQKAAQDYSNWWTKALREREIKEANLNQRSSAQQSKAAQDYTNWWTKALREREIREGQSQQRLQSSLRLYQDKANFNASRLLQSNGKFVDQTMLREWSNEVQRLTVNTPRLQQEMARLSERFRQISASANDAKKSSVSLTDQLSHSFGKIALWGGATSLFYGVTSGLQEMLQVIVQLDTQMTQLKRVMSENTNFDAMFESSIQLANDLGQKITTINESMIEYARTGLDPALVEEYSKATVLAMNISELTAKEASDTIIAGMLIFKDEVKDAVDLVSRLNEVDNNFAVTTKDLSNALMKAASSGKTAGVSLNELLGHVTAIQEATREGGKVIGNALKTIYVNITQDKGAIDALSKIGITMKDANGDLKSASALLEELAMKWNTLSEEEQRNTSLAIAKKYHINRLNALMINFNQALSASETALNSEGSAIRENAKYMESLQAKINKLSAAWEELSYVVGQSGLADAFSGALQLITGITRATSFLVEATKEWGGLLSVVTGALGGPLLSGFNAVASLSKTFGDSFTFSSTDTLIENAKATNLNADALDSLIQKYKELSNPGSKSIREQEELLRVLSQIQEIAPTLITSVDEYGNALSINADHAEKYASGLRTLSEEQLKLVEIKNQTDLQKVNEEIAQKQKEVNALLKDLESSMKTVTEYEDKNKVSSIDAAIEKSKTQLEETANKIALASASGNQRLKQELQEEYQIILDARNKYIQAKNYVLSQDTKSIDELRELSQTKKGYEDLKDAVDQARGAKKATADATNGLGIEFLNLNSEMDDALVNFEELEEQSKGVEDEFKGVSDSIAEYNSILQEVSEGKSISAEKAAQLILKEKELANAFTIENGMVKVNVEAFQEMRNKKLKAFADIEAARNKDLADQKSKLVEKLKGYGILIEGINSVKDAEDAITKIDNRMIEAKSIGEAIALEKAKRETSELKSGLVQIEQINKLISLVSSPTFGTKESSGSSSKSFYSALTDDAKKLMDIEVQLQEVQSKRSSLLQSSQEYRNSLQKEEDLLRQKVELLKKEYQQVTKNNYINGKVQNGKFSQKLSDDALKKANELTQQIIQLESKIESFSYEKLASSLKEFADKNDYLESRIKITQERMTSYSTTSQEYRDAIEEENNHLKLKQDNLHEEAELIRDQLANGKLTVAQREELNNKLIELQTSWLSLQNAINTKKLEQANSLLGEQKNKTDELSKSIELSKAKMDAVGDTTSEQYYTEYANYVQLIALKKQSLQEEITLREKLIQQNLHNLDLVRQYKMEIVDLQIEQIQLQETINQVTADKIIDTYKSVYEEQKNAALKALQTEEKQENERHKKKLDHIENERKKKEKATQKEIDAIDDAKKSRR